MGRIPSAREPEIAELNRRIAVDQQVAWLEIAVYQSRRVQILQRAKDLPEDVAMMHIKEDVGTDHRVDVGLHAFEDQVDVGVVLGTMDGEKGDDALMAEAAKEGDLAVGPLRVSRVLEGTKYFLQSNDLLRRLVDRLPDNPICTLPNFLNNLVPSKDLPIQRFNVLLLLTRHCGRRSAFGINEPLAFSNNFDHTDCDRSFLIIGPLKKSHSPNILIVTILIEIPKQPAAILNCLLICAPSFANLT
jgi:hypothetical protein